jgi:hypothetical protein
MNSLDVDIAREYAVNVYLEILNYVNTSDAIIRHNHGNALPSNKLTLSLIYGERRVPGYYKTDPDDIDIAIVDKGSYIYYSSPLQKSLSYKESLQDAIAILEKQHGVRNKENLRWLDFANIGEERDPKESISLKRTLNKMFDSGVLHQM